MPATTGPYNNEHTFFLTEEQAAIVFKLVGAESSAYKNWIATAVEHKEFDRAEKLVKELRDVQDLFPCFNIEAKKLTAEATGKPLVRIHRPGRV